MARTPRHAPATVATRRRRGRADTSNGRSTFVEQESTSLATTKLLGSKTLSGEVIAGGNTPALESTELIAGVSVPPGRKARPASPVIVVGGNSTSIEMRLAAAESNSSGRKFGALAKTAPTRSADF